MYAYASHSPTPSVGTAADKTVCAGNVGSAKDTPAALAATTAAAEQLPVRVRLHCSSSTQDLTTHTASSSNSSATDTSLGDSGGGNTGLVGSGRVLSHAYPTSDSAQSLTAAVGTEQSTVELDAQDKPAVSQVATDGCTQAEQGACLQGAPLTQPTQPLLTTVQHEDTGHRAGELVIYAGHKGFVRLAIENQASLVPVLALGEVLQLRDLLRWPALLKWSYKRLGFPCPYLVGEWIASVYILACALCARMCVCARVCVCTIRACVCPLTGIPVFVSCEMYCIFVGVRAVRCIISS